MIFLDALKVCFQTPSVSSLNLAWGITSVTYCWVLLYYFSGRALNWGKWHNMEKELYYAMYYFLERKKKKELLSAKKRIGNPIMWLNLSVIHSSVKWGRRIDVQCIIKGCKCDVYTKAWPNKTRWASSIVQLENMCRMCDCVLTKRNI